jgi:hypothetical protein
MNMASPFGQQEGRSTSILARLRRAIDRYEAVGWYPRAKAASELLHRISLQQTPAIWQEIEKFLGGNQIPWGHYGDAVPRHQHAVFPPEPPADHYIGCSDLCIISCFFNPCRYRSRVRNFEAFAASLSRSPGVHWRSIECAFGDSDFMLQLSDHILRVRSKSVLWQKERLLNRLIVSLPDVFQKVAWVDADVLFSSPSWIVDASDALDDYPVVQLFTYLQQRDDRLGGDGMDTLESYASLYQRDPDRALGPTYFHHGHTGVAWAGRRDWLERYGLYDSCLSGTGDHLMAHAFVGDWQPGCLGIGQGPAYLHFVQWCERVYPSLRARLGVVPSQATSLWHGPLSARDYYGAVCSMRNLGFDPQTDLQLNEDGCWEWSSDKPKLHRWTHEYFFRRREDG